MDVKKADGKNVKLSASISGSVDRPDRRSSGAALIDRRDLAKGPPAGSELNRTWNSHS